MNRYSNLGGKPDPKTPSNKPQEPDSELSNNLPPPGPTDQPAKSDITISRYQDIVSGDMVAIIRAAVILTGQASTNYRLTNIEKGRLEEVVWEFKKQGIRTTENEIVRIAINYLLNNHKKDGKDSLLAVTLNLLHR